MQSGILEDGKGKESSDTPLFCSPLASPLCSLLRGYAELFGSHLHVPVLWAGQSGAPSAALPVVETVSHCPAAGENTPGALGPRINPILCPRQRGLKIGSEQTLLTAPFLV